MPGKHKDPLLGWHASAEQQAFVRKEAKNRGVSISTVLNDALAWYIAAQEKIRLDVQKRRP